MRYALSFVLLAATAVAQPQFTIERIGGECGTADSFVIVDPPGPNAHVLVYVHVPRSFWGSSLGWFAVRRVDIPLPPLGFPPGCVWHADPILGGLPPRNNDQAAVLPQNTWPVGLAIYVQSAHASDGAWTHAILTPAWKITRTR